MVLAVVRSHYKSDSATKDREKVYRAGNALASWLGLDSWADIVAMQGVANRSAFAETVRKAE